MKNKKLKEFLNKTLKEFLNKNKTCRDGYLFASNLTLEEFLNKCQRGDWILWLFAKMNPRSIKELTLAKGHCANTVRHLMTDDESLKAVDTAIAFGEGRATRQELEEAANDAQAINSYTARCADEAAHAAASWADGPDYAASWAAEAYTDNDAEKENQKQTADICRKYLPIEIWDQSKL